MSRAFRRQFLAYVSAYAMMTPYTPALALTPGQQLLLFSGITPAYQCNYTLGALCGGESYSTTSLHTVTDKTGAVTFASNNLLLNSATLSTQNVTTNGYSNYIVSFTGTGSITLSGTASGTVSSSPGYLKITPTSGTLTLTVSGSVTNAVMAAVTYETTPRLGQSGPNDAVITTSAAYYGAPFDWSPTSIGVGLGLRVEESRTNLLPYSNTFGNAIWLFAQATVAVGTTGPDNISLSSATLTDTVSTAVHGIAQLLTTAPGNNYALSVLAKAGTGRYLSLALFNGPMTGAAVATFDLQTGLVTQSGSYGTNATLVSAPSGQAYLNGFWRLSIVGSNTNTTTYPEILLSNSATFTPDVYGRNAYTGTGSLYNYIWGAQLELGAFATSYIPTGASSVARAADVTQAQNKLATCLARPSGSIAIKTNDGSNANAGNAATLISANGTVMLGANASGHATTALGTTLSSTNTATWSSPNDTGLAWGPATGAIDLNGTATNDNHARTPGSPFYLGSTSGTGAFWDGHLKSSTCYNQQIRAPQ